MPVRVLRTQDGHNFYNVPVNPVIDRMYTTHTATIPGPDMLNRWIEQRVFSEKNKMRLEVVTILI